MFYPVKHRETFDCNQAFKEWARKYNSFLLRGRVRIDGDFIQNTYIFLLMFYPLTPLLYSQ